MICYHCAKGRHGLCYLVKCLGCPCKLGACDTAEFDRKWHRAESDAKDPRGPVLSLEDIRTKLRLTREEIR